MLFTGDQVIMVWRRAWWAETLTTEWAIRGVPDELPVFDTFYNLAATPERLPILVSSAPLIPARFWLLHTAPPEQP